MHCISVSCVCRERSLPMFEVWPWQCSLRFFRFGQFKRTQIRYRDDDLGRLVAVVAPDGQSADRLACKRVGQETMLFGAGHVRGRAGCVDFRSFLSYQRSK
jgi:hypothetical protein